MLHEWIIAFIASFAKTMREYRVILLLYIKKGEHYQSPMVYL